MMNIILIGPPGAGKDTQAKPLSEHFGYKHISTGELFREKVSQGDPYALELKEKYIDKGLFFPDNVAIDFVAKNLSPAGNIFNGIPRTLAQAALLDELARIDLVVEFELTPERAALRMAGREICQQCKRVYGSALPPPVPGTCACGGPLLKRLEDRHPETRYGEYVEKTLPIIAHYQKRNIVTTVNAENPPPVIFNQLKQIVEKLK